MMLKVELSDMSDLMRSISEYEYLPNGFTQMGDKESREIMRIIDKTFPKGSKNSFTEGLKNSTPLSPEQSKKDFEDFVKKQSRDGGRKANQDFN